MNYDPSIFAGVKTIAEAKAIILTPERTLSTDERWHRETPHIADLIDRAVLLDRQSVVLDYGCGIGRMCRELVRRHECMSVGVDIASNMRALAAHYVASESFFACSPSALCQLDIGADLVLAIWVLQHVAELNDAFALIRRSMKSSATLFVVNEARNRFVPSPGGWIDDGIDVRGALEVEFKRLDRGKLDPTIVGEEQSERTFWAAYARR